MADEKHYPSSTADKFMLRFTDINMRQDPDTVHRRRMAADMSAQNGPEMGAHRDG